MFALFRWRRSWPKQRRHVPQLRLLWLQSVLPLQSQRRPPQKSPGARRNAEELQEMGFAFMLRSSVTNPAAVAEAAARAAADEKAAEEAAKARCQGFQGFRKLCFQGYVLLVLVVLRFVACVAVVPGLRCRNEDVSQHRACVGARAGSRGAEPSEAVNGRTAIQTVLL